jgi:hypothetical protein
MKRNMCVQILIKLLFYSQIETRQKKNAKFIAKWHLLIEGWRMMDCEVMKYLFKFLKMSNCL